MKKFIALLLVCVICAAFAACSIKTSVETAAPAETAASADAPAATEAPDSGSSGNSGNSNDSGNSGSSGNSGNSGMIGNKFASISAYLEDSEWKDTFKSIQDMLGDMMTVSCYAEGDTLVYDYKYTSTYTSTVLDSITESLEDSLNEDSTAQNFTGVAETLQQYVVINDPAVKVIYRNGDDSVIAQKTYYPN